MNPCVQNQTWPLHHLSYASPMTSSTQMKPDVGANDLTQQSASVSTFVQSTLGQFPPAAPKQQTGDGSQNPWNHSLVYSSNIWGGCLLEQFVIVRSGRVYSPVPHKRGDVYIRIFDFFSIHVKVLFQIKVLIFIFFSHDWPRKTFLDTIHSPPYYWIFFISAPIMFGPSSYSAPACLLGIGE